LVIISRKSKTVQWPKEKRQIDKRWSTKHYTENTDWAVWGVSSW